MTRVLKEVGRFKVETWTEGWPMWITVQDDRHKTELRLLTPEDARDLRYALDRILSQIEPSPPTKE